MGTPWPKRKKKNSFLLMLKHTKERVTQLLNNTSYNIVCTQLCIEHFLLPIKKNNPRVWKNDDIFWGKASFNWQLPEGPNTKSLTRYWERINWKLCSGVTSTTTTTQNHPQNILPMVQLTQQRWNDDFSPNFCVSCQDVFIVNYDSESQSKLSKC